MLGAEMASPILGAGVKTYPVVIVNVKSIHGCSKKIRRRQHMVQSLWIEFRIKLFGSSNILHIHISCTLYARPSFESTV